MARKQQNGRQPNGTFAPGNPGGPGRPARATEAGYMRVVMNACDLDTWQAIVDRAVTDAKAGDGQARAWLARYLMGKPTDRSAPRPSVVLAKEDAGDLDGDIEKERAMQELDRLMRGIG